MQEILLTSTKEEYRMKKKLYLLMVVMLAILSVPNLCNAEFNARQGRDISTPSGSAKAKKRSDSVDERIKKMVYKRPRRVDWKKQLGLNKEQEQILKNLYAENQKRIDALLMQMEQAMADIQKIYDEEEENIRLTLDKDQNIKYEKFKYREHLTPQERKQTEKPSRKKMRKL